VKETTVTTDSQSAGATPVAEGATPSQSSSAQPTTGTDPAVTAPATGAEAQLGDAGKRALDTMKAEKRASDEARKTAEQERDALQQRLESLENASKSDQEKAITAARKEGETAATEKWAGIIRAARVESALVAAGAIDPALAALAPEFVALKVADDGTVANLDTTLEAWKEAHPTQFGKATPADFGGGSRGAATRTEVQPGADRLRHAYESTS
jgi:hypothetical protein